VAHARKAGTSSTSRRRPRTTGARQQTASIRTWAKDHGMQVNERGRIPANVVKEYDAAH
jgi:hypothetical protein